MTQSLHRGRPHDHRHLVVRDLAASGGRPHLAFQAKDCATVDRFRASDTGNNKSGGRSHRSAAFVFDPDGSDVEAAFPRVAQPSSASLQIDIG